MNENCCILNHNFCQCPIGDKSVFCASNGLASNRQLAITRSNVGTVYWWLNISPGLNELIHRGRVTHICISKLTIIGSDNGLSPGQRQAIIWTNAGILLIQTFGTNSSEILNAIHIFSFKKMHLQMSSAKWRLFRLGLNELTDVSLEQYCGGFGENKFNITSWNEGLEARCILMDVSVNTIMWAFRDHSEYGLGQWAKT